MFLTKNLFSSLMLMFTKAKEVKNKTTVTVITINKNNKYGLEKTIKSVIAQSYPSIEYIIIDGNSEDGSDQILEKYRSKVSLITQEDDSGIYEAMNKGISNATGDYILFLNSGDYLVGSNVVETMFTDHQIDASFIYGNLWKGFDDHSELSKGYEGREISLLTGSFFL